MSEERIKELEAENSRLKELLAERNKISGELTLQLQQIAGVVFQDYPTQKDYESLVSTVKSLVESRVPVSLLNALQSWLETMERRSVSSITKADTRLAEQIAAWLKVPHE